MAQRGSDARAAARWPPTARGRAWADLLRIVGFDLRETRVLTGARYRLVRDAPGLAAVLRTILLAQDMVRLVVESAPEAPRQARERPRSGRPTERTRRWPVRSSARLPSGPSEPWAIEPGRASSSRPPSTTSGSSIAARLRRQRRGPYPQASIHTEHLAARFRDDAHLARQANCER